MGRADIWRFSNTKSPMSKSAILITGAPGCGKTTLIKRISRSLKAPAFGFITGEIRREGVRVGFSIASLQGEKGVMSHIGITSPYKVGKYGVDMEAFEKIAIPQLETGMRSKKLVLIDEIGKMELFSAKFRELVIEIFESGNPLIATIMQKPNPLCDRLKSHPNSILFTLTRNNHDEIFREILEAIRS